MAASARGPSAAKDVCGWALRRAPGCVLTCSANAPIPSDGVLAWSKTFDVSLALRDFGAPSVSVQEGLERFVEWQHAQWTRHH